MDGEQRSAGDNRTAQCGKQGQYVNIYNQQEECKVVGQRYDEPTQFHEEYDIQCSAGTEEPMSQLDGYLNVYRCGGVNHGGRDSMTQSSPRGYSSLRSGSAAGIVRLQPERVCSPHTISADFRPGFGLRKVIAVTASRLNAICGRTLFGGAAAASRLTGHHAESVWLEGDFERVAET